MRVIGTAAAKLTVSRSRFHACVFPVRTEEDLELGVKAQKTSFRKARHHCWACRYADGGELVERWKDDGEVGHPGQVLLEVLRKHDLDGAIVVSRVFGGVKLGVGGVSRAFREAGELAVEALLARGR